MNNLKTSHNHMSLWIFSNALMVFLMVAIGGITRLTDSGLSMTDWNFFSGMVPPLNDQDWNLLFDKYKLFPEFKILNYGMTLSEFKKIFFWEYLHRMWGRLIGLTFIVPFLYFLCKGVVNKKLKILFLCILSLGCFQGFMGWYMVSSGLVDRPDVSQYRLAAHLGVAFIIYTFLVFIGWNLFGQGKREKQLKKYKENFSYKNLVFSYFLLFTTIISGAFVAGTDAGLVYNSFPLMGQNLFPNDAFDLNPYWINFFENMSLIQFNHRLLATFTCFYIIITVIIELGKKPEKIHKRFLIILAFLIITQYLLGITAVLYAVPFLIGLVHQLGALLNLTLLTLIISEKFKNNYSLI